MARLSYAPRALDDLDRLVDFLFQRDPQAALQTVELVTEAVRILENHPPIGRPAEEGLRELVISRGRSGYLALYGYVEAQDAAVILAVRHQREAGYPEPPHA